MKLIYFPARGSCDQIRLLLAEAGIEFEEESISGIEYSKMKESFPFSQLPVLEDGSMRITHAHAIMRYIARKARVNGQNDVEVAQCDMWDEQCNLVQLDFWNQDFMKNVTRLKTLLTVQDFSEYKLRLLKEKYFDEVLVHQLKCMTQVLSQNDSPFTVGKQLTYIDIKLFSLLDAINKEIPLALPSFPLLERFHQSIQTRPRIAQFCASGRRY